MNEMIYYPGFEVRDENWLKFALLYLEKLNPIIPFSGDEYLSDLFYEIADRTNFIDIHRPDSSEGYSATLDAIQITERILESPRLYERIFGNKNFVGGWKSPNLQIYELFEDKYTEEWEKFCIDNKLAKKGKVGIKLNRELGLLYMTILAQVISEIREMEIITDNPFLDRFSIFTRVTDASKKEATQMAKAIIQIEIPKNLVEIDLKKIIELRSKPSFVEHLEAFHSQLKIFFDSYRPKQTKEDFKRSLGTSWDDLKNDIIKLFGGLAVTGLGAWIALQAPILASKPLIKEIIGGLTLVVGSTISIRKSWKNSRTRRLTRKYLADLRHISDQNCNEEIRKNIELSRVRF